MKPMQHSLGENRKYKYLIFTNYIPLKSVHLNHTEFQDCDDNKNPFALLHYVHYLLFVELHLIQCYIRTTSCQGLSTEQTRIMYKKTPTKDHVCHDR